VSSAVVWSGSRQWQRTTVGLGAVVGLLVGLLVGVASPAAAYDGGSTKSNAKALPINMSNSAGSFWGNNEGLTSQGDQSSSPGTQSCPGGQCWNKVTWWTWTAPKNGEYEFTAWGKDGPESPWAHPGGGTLSADNTLEVWTGSGGNTLILQNDDNYGLSAQVTFSANAGQKYWLGLGSYSNRNPGWSRIDMASEPPTAPTGVAATPGNAQATVSWSHADPAGQAVTKYKVYAYVANTLKKTAEVTGNPPGRSMTMTGLTNGTAYTFKVSAWNSVGESAKSNSSVAVTPTGPALTPTFGVGTNSDNQFTVQVSNYNSAYNWGVSATKGSASISNSGLVTVTGLAYNEKSTVTVATSRTGYANGSAQYAGQTNLGPALTPIFGTPTATADGFTVPVSNYNGDYTFTASSGEGSATVNNSGLVTVTDVNPGQEATVTVNTTRANYQEGTASVTSRAEYGAALTPEFGDVTQTVDGFTVPVTNYDSDYTWDVSSSAGSATIGNSGVVTVTGLNPGQEADVTVTTARSGYHGGVNDMESSAQNGPALVPVFGAPSGTADGFTVQVTNYDSDYTWQVTTTDGSVAIDGSGLVTVTGLPPGGSAEITVQTTRTGYDSGTADLESVANNGPALTPTFSATTGTADGFTVQVTNYDSNYTWAVNSVDGTATIDNSGLITVTGLNAGQETDVVVNTSRTGYDGGTGLVTANANTGDALTPAFGTVTQTVDGFTVQVTNYDSDYTWDVTSTAGAVTISGSGVITVTGLNPGQEADVTVRTTRTGYFPGVADLTNFAETGPALTPTFGTVTQTVDGFTVQVTNYDSNYTWQVTSSAGAVTISGSGLITVTGLNPGQEADITVSTTRTGYHSAVANLTNFAETGPALTPTFGTVTQTADGFTVQVTNYDSDYTWTAASQQGTAAIDGSGLVTVTGLDPGQDDLVTVRTTRTGYHAGVADVAGEALIAAGLKPRFDTRPTATADGFTVQIDNYDAAFTWTVISSPGVANISTTGLVTVTGVNPGQAVLVSARTTRTGYYPAQTLFLSRAKTGPALTPTFDTPTATTDGFTVQVSNYDSDYTWAVASDTGEATISDSGMVTVTKLNAGHAAAVTVTTDRTGYQPGLATVSGAAITGAPLIPTFNEPTATVDGFTVQVTNYDPDYTWTTNPDTSTATISSTGLVTVTGLEAGQDATAGVITNRLGYDTGEGGIKAAAKDNPALIPTFDTPISTSNGYTAQITNYDPAFTWTASSDAGTVTITTTGLITVTDLDDAETATTAVTTTRTNYLTGTGTVTGTAAPGSKKKTITELDIRHEAKKLRPKRTRLVKAYAITTTKLAKQSTRAANKKSWIKKVSTTCQVNGNKITGKNKRAICGLTTTTKKRTAVVKSHPTCTVGVKVRVKIVAKAPGAKKTRWKNTWKVQDKPRTVCKLRANG
jgi:hypothetical protein